jgi:hypothetical protein
MNEMTEKIEMTARSTTMDSVNAEDDALSERSSTNHAEHMKDMNLSMTSGKPGKPGKPSLWESRGVYFQLNPKRKERLREIARSRGIEDSPLKALAAYIDEAQEGPRGSPKAMEFDTAGDIDDLRSMLCSRLDGLEQSMEQIHQMVKEGSFEVGVNKNMNMGPPLAGPIKENMISYEPPSLLAWLDAPIEDGGLAVYSLALLQARWMATKADARELGKIAFELIVEALHVDGCAVDDSYEMRVLLANMDPQSPLAASVAQSLFHPIHLACKKNSSGGWHVATFQEKNAIALGQQLAWHGS